MILAANDWSPNWGFGLLIIGFFIVERTTKPAWLQLKEHMHRRKRRKRS